MREMGFSLVNAIAAEWKIPATTITVLNGVFTADAHQKISYGEAVTKFGCGMALCGACTVYIDAIPTRSCITPLNAIGNKAVTTIEGAFGSVFEKVKKAWIELDVVQCGYCQPGQLMAATALLSANRAPTDQ